jgi:hypothetical protein
MSVIATLQQWNCGSGIRAKADISIKNLAMEPLASGKGFAQLVATAPQIQTFRRTNAVVIVIFAAPSIAALPEISAFCGTSPDVRKVRINQRRFCHDAYAVLRLSDVNPVSFRTREARARLCTKLK